MRAAKLFTALIFLSIALFSLTGCFCSYRLCPDRDPPPLPPAAIPPHIRLALVLGGGGARGLAHVGVLEEFENAGIPIDLIVGCSAGSLVGALYADCPYAEYVKTLLEPLKAKFLIDIDLSEARYGLSQGRYMKRVLRRCLYAKQFNELQIPFLLVATDLCSTDLVVIGGGDIIPAVQASCALPVIFAPVQLYGRVLVDGGVIDPVPVRVAKDLNAEIIVAVDLRGLLPTTTPTNLFEVATRSAEVTLLWQSEACIKDADVIIRPDLEDIGCFEDKFNDRIYRAGRKAAQDAIPKIKQLLAEKAKGS